MYTVKFALVACVLAGGNPKSSLKTGCTAPAIVVWGHGHSAQVQPTKPKDPVIDATGAGDALVAGFLAGVLAGGDSKSCLETGCKVAAMMVTRLGVTLPNDVPDGIFK